MEFSLHSMASPRKAREGGPKEHRAKQKWPREANSVTYAPGLSTLSHNVAQPKQLFLSRPTPSIQPNLSLPRTRPPLNSAINTLLVYSTHPFVPHAQTFSILSDLTYSTRYSLSIPALQCTS